MKKSKKLYQFVPIGDYREAKARLGEKDFSVLMEMLRVPCPPGMLSDEEIYEGTRQAVELGYLDVLFRYGKNGFEVYPKFNIPKYLNVTSDNVVPFAKGEARRAK